MNIIEKYFINKAIKKAAKSTDQNKLYRMVFQLLNSELPITIGEKNQKEYITKGFGYNDLIYSIITTKLDVTKTIDWQMMKVVDEKAMKGYNYYMKAFSRGKNPHQSLKLAKKYREKALQEDAGQMSKLIDNANLHQGVKDIASEYIGWYNLMGNFYLYGMPDASGKSFQSLHVAPANEVEIIAGDWFDPVKGYKLKSYLGNDEIPPDQMLHIKTWNPDFDYDGRQLYGMSPLRAGARILGLDNIGIDTSAANFKNSGVRGIIHQATHKEGYGGELTAEQAEQLKKKVLSDYSGTGKSGGLAATNAPIGFTKIGDTPVDLGIYTAMDKNVVRLCNLFKVPPVLFLPGATFNNQAEARKSLVTQGILPDINIFRERLNKFWIEPYNKGNQKYYLDYDLFSIFELQDDLSDIAAMYKDLDFVTKNEKRAALNYGQHENDPLGLADELYINPMEMPMSSADVMLDEELKEIEQNYLKLVQKMNKK